MLATTERVTVVSHVAAVWLIFVIRPGVVGRGVRVESGRWTE